MELFRLGEVLIVNVTGTRGVNPDEVILPRVFDERVAKDLAHACVECGDLFDGYLLFLVAYPVFGVAPASIFIVTDDAVLGGRGRVWIILA